MQRGYKFSRVCQCVYLSVCPVRAVTSEWLYLYKLILARKYIFRISRSRSIIKVMGQGHIRELNIHLQMVCLQLKGNLAKN